MAKKSRFKLEVYHPNSFRVLRKKLYKDKIIAVREFNRFKRLWKDYPITLLKKIEGKWEPVRYTDS